MFENDPIAKARYDRCIANGCSEKLAEMLATRSFPGFSTNDTFLKGSKSGEQFCDNPALGSYYRSVAEWQGVSTAGKKYLSALAAYPGDPKAWVSSKEDVIAVCKERGWRCEGVVNYDPPELKDAPTPDLSKPYVAPEIIRDRVDDILSELPEPDAVRMREEVEDRVQRELSGEIDDHAPLVSDHNFEEIEA